MNGEELFGHLKEYSFLKKDISQKSYSLAFTFITCRFEIHIQIFVIIMFELESSYLCLISVTKRSA
jgi:hypothetical protein